jgi:two-component system KDP operon response regulator KdpE
VIPSRNLVEYVWGYRDEEGRTLLRGLVQRLRVKVEPDPQNPDFILTEKGIGYRFMPGGDDNL